MSVEPGSTSLGFSLWGVGAPVEDAPLLILVVLAGGEKYPSRRSDLPCEGVGVGSTETNERIGKTRSSASGLITLESGGAGPLPPTEVDRDRRGREGEPGDPRESKRSFDESLRRPEKMDGTRELSELLRAGLDSEALRRCLSGD